MGPFSNEPMASLADGLNQPELLSEPTEPINRTDITSPVSPSGKDECYLVLAQVNLLRIRKQLSEAISLCESAIANWPYRADAHALLGDLYQECERYDDAILRYCRVLELDPKNRSNRGKLSDTVRMKRLQLGPKSFQKQQTSKLRADRVMRVIILALATLMLLAIMIAPIVVEKRKFDAISNENSSTIDRRILANPINITNAFPTPEPKDSNAESPQPANLVLDSNEQLVLSGLTDNKTLLPLGIQFVNVQEDPVNSAYTITFLDRGSLADDDLRLSVLRHSLLVVQAANTAISSVDVKELTIRCLLLSSSSTVSTQPAATTPSTTPILAFVGTIQRSDVPENNDLDDFSADALQALFASPWWNANIQ
jgi:hypothetical protein